jgi:hypothetical protein
MSKLPRQSRTGYFVTFKQRLPDITHRSGSIKNLCVDGMHKKIIMMPLVCCITSVTRQRLTISFAGWNAEPKRWWNCAGKSEKLARALLERETLTSDEVRELLFGEFRLQAAKFG